MARQHTAWVIEVKLGSVQPPRFYAVDRLGNKYWPNDIRKAVKFSTRDSARAVLRRERDSARVVEKQFG